MKAPLFYFLMLVVNLIIVALIGLQPHYLLFSMPEPSGGLEGLFPMVLSTLTWIPSIAIALALAFLLIKLLKPQPVKYWIIIGMTVVIHGLVSVSIWPGMYLAYIAKYTIATAQYAPTFTLLEESKTGYTYSYTLQIHNKSKQTFDNVTLYVRPSITNLPEYFDHESLVAVQSNIGTTIDLPPGSTIVTGSVALSPQAISQYGPEHLQDLQIGIYHHYLSANEYSWLPSSLDWSEYF